MYERDLYLVSFKFHKFIYKVIKITELQKRNYKKHLTETDQR